MNWVFLNGEYMPSEQAKISPMDRGFLFGDGIYEVIPSYGGKFVGFEPHILRLQQGLAEIEINLPIGLQQWRDICQQLAKKNGNGNLGIYLQVSRGTSPVRYHAYPDDIEPTVFAYAFEIPPAPVADKEKVKAYRVKTLSDLRWQRCNIKSTALLGNVMHFQTGYKEGFDEVLLFNQDNMLTEAAACNAFVVTGKVIATPPLDSQLLPGITRLILLDVLRQYSHFTVEERSVSKAEVLNADEVWITSSTKQVAPVISIDNNPVGGGRVGDVWHQAQQLFSEHQFDY
ncbi:D-amino acid aminotransferase [Thalassotalea mangrovi]|uniref:Aminodeoxychorismate lyase n=1 Tax=Thalassotalea mangrovi TaxID=2572245 RepID=A0A4U1B2Z4_9GAMM|nr:D-amino acid aminotransferase [Thalassotalea mangrovi]TKB44082.1 D-alanine aminotransferase [Thalassotalea mangrovi]